MPLFSQQNGLIKTGNSLGTNQGCCCDITCTAAGAASGGAGVTTNTYPFPSSEQEVFFAFDAFFVPDKFSVSACGTTLFTTGTTVSGPGAECFTKPAGCDEIEIRVDGDPGTAWVYRFECECPPPPPPRPCCSKIATCGDQDFWSCSGSEANCCADLDPEADCSGESPPVTECEPNYAASVPQVAPFDCLGRTDIYYRTGAWVETSGWDVWDATGNDPADFDAGTQTLYNHAEGLINSSYFAEWDGCFANADITFTTSGPTVTIGEDTYNTTWETRVILDMCERTVQVSASETSAGLASFAINAELTAQTAITPPCNAYSGCYCSSWSAVPFFGGGQVNVGL
jgi:hypothetical protein